MKRLTLWLVPAVLATACASPWPGSTNTAAANSTRPPQANGPALAIGTVTPDRLSVDDGRVGSQTLSVAYSIPDPGSVTSAELKLYGYEGLLMYRDIGYTPVAPRFAELKLVVTRGAVRVEAVKRVAFINP